MSPAPQALEATVTSHIDLVDGNLTWTQAGASGQVSLDEVLFILDNSEQYSIYHLKEDPESAQDPFRLHKVQARTLPFEDLQPYIIKQLPLHLQHGPDNEVDVIVSTRSGAGLAIKVWEEVLRPLWQSVAARGGPVDGGTPCHVLITQSATSVREFSKELWSSRTQNSTPSRTVVLLSGDGGAVDLLNGTDEDAPAGPLPVMALLPLGTGNALFHSTHKPLYSESGPTPLVLGLRTMFQGTPSALPVFRASFSAGSRLVAFTEKSKESGQQDDGSQGSENNFSKQEQNVSRLNGAIVASYGFHASIVYESDTPEYRAHGAKRFGMVAAELLRQSHPYAAEVEIRRRGSPAFERIRRSTHTYLLVALVSNMERTFAISPATKPLEGALRLVHFGPIGGERTMEVMMKAYDGGKHVDLKWEDGERVGYEEVDEVRVVTREDDERWRKVCIDGTIVVVPKDGHMGVRMLEGGLFRILANPRVLPAQ